MKLPIGIQNFESLRKDGYLYVDKTERIWDLIEQGRYFFLSRPRRFGKSLLMSTLHAYFDGKKELFEDLAIAQHEQKWEAHPVLHLDLNTQQYDKPERLATMLDRFLRRGEETYGIQGEGDDFGPRFESLIEAAYKQTGKGVVILVDEYDKPMLQAIGNRELQDGFRAILKSFYGALKSMDGCIRFALLTGVTKFGKVSVFSDLNNLNDISMDARYYDICGITEQELLSAFDKPIDTLAAANGMTRQECIDALRVRYDGYHFEETAPGMYNPFSVLNTFDKNKFGSYWFETGTPTYLVQLLQLSDYNLEAMSQVETDSDVLNSVDSMSHDPIPVIYQSGYLTIKGYDPEFCTYQLGFPNKEVEEGFVKFLVPFYTSRKEQNSAFNLRLFVTDVRDGQTESFIKRLRSLFADTPYEIVKDLENHYQNVLWLLFKLMGYYVQAEYHTSEGRIDLVLQTPKFCYVLEFKLDGTADEALQQISDKNYTLPFEMNGQKIIRIGISFSSQTRNISEWKVVQ